jgi:mono/diheme cytochrome c family protein
MNLRGHRTIAIVLVVLGVLGGVFVYRHLSRTDVPVFASDEDHFLFGSIGTEESEGIPYWLWLVLPRIFPEYLPAPGGYASLGVLSKDGREMPVGFSKVTIGYERVGTNCALCHTASVRLRADDPPVIVPAAPAHELAMPQYLRFLFACASDPRFTADTILAEVAKNYQLPMPDRLLFRFVVIPSTRRNILRLAERYSWADDRTAPGRGRVDLLNAIKFGLLRQPADATVGNADMPAVWNLNAQAGRGYLWDGSNTSVQEVVVSSAIGAGSGTRWIDGDVAKSNTGDPLAMSSLNRVQRYLSAVRPPAYPLAIDRHLADSGAGVFDRQCGSCHSAGGPRTGTVIPIAEVATDPSRLATWTPAVAAAYTGYSAGHPWSFSHFRASAGYVAVSLEGLWLRAPYLHNGSVPTLQDLLAPPASRPSLFWRGYNVYDGVRVGFMTTGHDAQAQGTAFDTTQPGNSNRGHVYGTSLVPDEKRALLEYLKTL